MQPRPKISPFAARRLCAALAMAFASAVVLPSAAAPTVQGQARDLAAELTGVGGTDDRKWNEWPGGNDLPQEDFTPTGNMPVGTATMSQVSAVENSKLFLTIDADDPIWGLVYVSVFNTPADNPTSYRRVTNAPFPFGQPDCATDDPSTQKTSTYVRSVLYPISPQEGGGGEVGLLAETTVNTVAFGSLPTTVTVRLSTPRGADGRPEPLTVSTWLPKTNPILSGFGCDPTFVPEQVGFVEGQIEISLTDLVIDGVPVDLGESCTSESAVPLQLWAQGDYTVLDGGRLASYDGFFPGSSDPLNGDYYLEDNGRSLPPSSGLDIPPFIGCGAGGENLDDIVTSMISGEGNPISVEQGQVIQYQSEDGEFLPPDLGELAKCSTLIGYGCPYPGPEAPANPPVSDE